MDPMTEEEGGGRWDRARRSRGSRTWLGPFLVIVVVPILIRCCATGRGSPERSSNLAMRFSGSLSPG